MRLNAIRYDQIMESSSLSDQMKSSDQLEESTGSRKRKLKAITDEIINNLSRKNRSKPEMTVTGNGIPYVPGCICEYSLSLKISDSCRTLPNSLENLADNLKSRVRPENCTSCSKDNLCNECRSKETAEQVFPNTYKHVKQNFGIQHLDKFF